MACFQPEPAGGDRRPSGRSSFRPWVVTLVATAISVYVLDIVATIAGVALVASGALADLDPAPLALFLAATYVVWGLGLRQALKANWDLLEATGTSTNVVSKAAYDLAGRHSAGVTIRRLASGAGYVVVELAKEAPYYAGAFGAAAFTDMVSSREALIFLGGANLGAACYEFGLAFATRSCLGRPAPRVYASFDEDWSAKDYLAQYYSVVEADERRTIAFLVEAMASSPPDGPVLFFGVGPRLHHVFSVVPHAREIHLGDYLGSNLDEIERWIAGSPDAHDWRPFIRYTLQCEGAAAPTDGDVRRREALARARITDLIRVDLRSAAPLGARSGARYALVISAYCADSITSDRETWELYMGRIAGLVSDGGVLIVAALRAASCYRIGDKAFPSANVDERDVRSVLERFCAPGDLAVEVCDVPECASQGYDGVVLSRARIGRALAEAA